MATLRRRDRWTHVVDPMDGPRWRLDGTTLALQYDPLDSGGPLRGAWCVWLGQYQAPPSVIDHYLDGSMAYVEGMVDSGIARELWARVAREQIDGIACQSQGCHCTPSLPCDAACDGRQHNDGSTVSCTMCVRERTEMMEQG